MLQLNVGSSLIKTNSHRFLIKHLLRAVLGFESLLVTLIKHTFTSLLEHVSVSFPNLLFCIQYFYFSLFPSSTVMIPITTRTSLFLLTDTTLCTSHQAMAVEVIIKLKIWLKFWLPSTHMRYILHKNSKKKILGGKTILELNMLGEGGGDM